MKKAVFPVIGMMCASCSARVERCLNEQDGVSQASVNLAGRTALVEYDERVVTPEQLKQAVDAQGYELVVESDRSVELLEQRAVQRLRGRMIVAWLLALAVMALSMHWVDLGGLTVNRQTMLILSVVSLLYCGRDFFVNTIRQLRHRSASMDTLVALSTGISFLFSAFNTLWGEAFWTPLGLQYYTYFDASVMITAFVLLERWLEQRAAHGTSAAIRSLMQLQPKTARLHSGEGYTDIPLASLQRGDCIEVRPGERIPVDGTVIGGSGVIDESTMTGEAVPVEVSEGSRVVSGTMLQHGTVVIRSEKVGAQTQLAAMIRTVEEAQGSKAPVQRLVDRVALVFVPTVMLISLLTFLLWLILPMMHGHDALGMLPQALMSAVSVLVIACPCALGLATPTALMVGMGKAAQRGILVRDATALEGMKALTDLVLDKTGTLTRPRGGIDVTRANHLKPEEREELSLHAAEAVEQLSRQGVEAHLMSGDKQDSVAYWTGRAGIADFQAAVLPQDKYNKVRELQAADRVVGMVGDGVNDAEALAVADVSIAMGKGTDVAMNVAQVTLMHADLLLLPEAMTLSRQTVSTIRQNLFWAFVYNVVCIPLAAGLPHAFGSQWQITPMWASALMAFSSVSVVLNSLRLKYK